jgi:hypothetical protein
MLNLDEMVDIKWWQRAMMNGVGPLTTINLESSK